MKKYIYCFVFLVMLSMWGNARKAEAYSVTVEENGVYAKVIPSSIMENVAPIFKKQVRKAMKYYNKYKDKDEYAYVTEVPDEYRDFIEVAKQIQDSDAIVIGHPFYLYDIYEAVEGELRYSYYFFVEKNQKKLCIFSIDVKDGKTVFSYDKMMDRYAAWDGKITDLTLFYQIGEVIFAETPEQVSVLKDTTYQGGIRMEGPADNEEAMVLRNKEAKAFYQKKYEDKRDVILEYLEKIRDGKPIEKADENIKLELKEEYNAPKDVTDKKTHGIGLLHIAGAVAILCIFAAVVVLAVKRRKNKEQHL